MLIHIVGHTDDSGIEARNKILSTERAKAVADYLVMKGIDKNRTTFEGVGSSKPFAAGNTEEERGRNRRIEFILMDKDGKSITEESTK